MDKKHVILTAGYILVNATHEAAIVCSHRCLIENWRITSFPCALRTSLKRLQETTRHRLHTSCYRYFFYFNRYTVYVIYCDTDVGLLHSICARRQTKSTLGGAGRYIYIINTGAAPKNECYL